MDRLDKDKRKYIKQAEDLDSKIELLSKDLQMMSEVINSNFLTSNLGYEKFKGLIRKGARFQ